MTPSVPLLHVYAKKMRRQPTLAESRLWRLLRDRRLEGLKFRRQVPIGPYVADFVCYRLRLIVEADGPPHGESRTDSSRDLWFARQGFTVLRFSNERVVVWSDGVLAEILGTEK
jgi:very-short-patch-repair endonuclease